MKYLFRIKYFLPLILSLLVCGNLSAAERPNIVLILFDDAAYSDFHPFGNPPYATPHVAKLAAEGVRYTRFHVPQAVCSASRAALLTGCYPHHTQVVNAIGPGMPGLDPEFPIMSVALKKHGYATAHFGKWHIGDIPATRPTARGFDEHAGLLVSNGIPPAVANQIAVLCGGCVRAALLDGEAWQMKAAASVARRAASPQLGFNLRSA